MNRCLQVGGTKLQARVDEVHGNGWQEKPF